jgi:hypothetical protein
VIEPPRLVGKILNGEKTRSTRPRRDVRDVGWQPGHSYGVRAGRDKPEATRVKVTALEHGMLDQVNEEDARAEGFDDLAGFFAHFRERWGTGPLIPVEVEIVHYELDLEAPPRLLARHSERGYVKNPREALEEEGEAIDEATQDSYSAEADARFAKLRAEEREREDARRQVARLRELRARARSQGEELPEIPEIDKLLRQAEARLANR